MLLPMPVPTPARPRPYAHGHGRRLTSAKYPLRLGLMADVGQTVNSSLTMQQMMANNPQVVLMAGDNAYADNYRANNPDEEGGNEGTNQQRWDSYFTMWEPLYCSVPSLNAVGNHEVGARPSQLALSA